MMRLFVDGEENGSVPADDPGLLFGLTAFDTMRTYGKVVFRLGAHIERLQYSAESLGIPFPGHETVEQEIASVLADDISIRYMLTGGGRRVMQLAPIKPEKVGGAMQVARMDWDPPEWLPGVIKHGCRAAWVIGARELGVDEVILVDRDGFILEANRSNVVAVVDGVLMTPPLDGRFLSGVTRQALLEVARSAGLRLEERPLPYDSQFEELYLTSTLKEVAPVVEIDGAAGPGAGPLGEALHRAYRDLIAKETGADFGATQD